jgi:hypothetical protein
MQLASLANITHIDEVDASERQRKKLTQPLSFPHLCNMPRKEVFDWRDSS